MHALLCTRHNNLLGIITNYVYFVKQSFRLLATTVYFLETKSAALNLTVNF